MQVPKTGTTLSRLASRKGVNPASRTDRNVVVRISVVEKTNVDVMIHANVKNARAKSARAKSARAKPL